MENIRNIEQKAPFELRRRKNTTLYSQYLKKWLITQLISTYSKITKMLKKKIQLGSKLK